MIKGILFDWVGVLLKEKGSTKNRSELYNLVKNGKATDKDVKELVLSFEKYQPLWNELEELSKKYKLCVVNNGPKETMKFWDEFYRYSDLMEFINSDDLGIAKPDCRIYEYACKLIGVKPSEVIYMDDNDGFPKETQELGMTFIKWNNHDQGFKEFKDNLERISDGS